MVLPTTFVIPRTLIPFAFASRIAARVSAVSPDWLIVITRSPFFRTGFLYLNSLAYSTSTGIRAYSSIRYSATSPACHDVPHAIKIILSILLKSSSFNRNPSSLTIPSSIRILPLNALVIVSGCSKISLSMKWSKPCFSMDAMSQSIDSISLSILFLSRS